MATASLSKVLSHLRGILARPDTEGQTDGELLDRFLSRREESAFEGLLRRHGPMVLGVCRRILGNSHDAEDAFQATFLVLVRRGESIRPRSRVGKWLYGVAYRTALEARRAAARRRLKEARAMPRTEPHENVWTELRPLLDRELSRLPDKYRMPLVLCDLEGATRKEAAHHLGWAEGTLSSRLSRGRDLLARRLKRHGLTLIGATMAGLLAEGAATASVPAPLVGSTIKARLLLAAGRTAEASVAAANAVALTERMVYLMRIVKLKCMAAVALGVSLVAGVLYHGLAGQTPAEQTAKAVTAKEDRLVAAEKAAPADEEKKAVSVKEMPPVVVRTVPQAGDTEVDAAKVTEIRVTYSKEMMDKSWSWTQISDETFPKINGEVRYDKDRRTCILPVKLEAGKTYVIWLNSEQFHNFKDADGQSAVPYLLVFETKPAK